MHHKATKISSNIWRVAVLVVLIACLLVVLLTQLTYNSISDLTKGWSLDYRQYWGAARVLVQRSNPYDAATLGRMEASSGQLELLPVMMWNPPWTLALVLPFAMLPFALSAFVWLVMSIVIFLGCGIALWNYYELPRQRSWLGALVIMLSYPVFWGLQYGQIHAWILLGVTGFLVAAQKGRDELAGVSLALLTIKPHVVYLFIACALWWIIRERRWRIILGGSATLLVMCLIVGVLSPDVFSQYVDAIQRAPIYWRSSTLGTWLRVGFGFEHLWLQYLPTVVGTVGFCVWLLLRQRPLISTNGLARPQWTWKTIAPWALIVSALTAPYGWTFDKIILLPVVFAFLARSRMLPRWQLALSIVAYLIAQLALFIILQRTELGESVTYIYPVLFFLLYLWQELGINSRTHYGKESTFA